MRRGTLNVFRRRAAVELGVLTLGASTFLVLVPARPVVVDMTLAALALVFVGLGRDTTREMWRPPPPAPRAIRATWILAAATVAAAAILGIAGRARFTPSLFVTLLVFVPWAWLQHAMFQFYLLGRLRVLLGTPGAVPLAALNATAFAASHAPDWDVVVVTWPVGWLWSVYYLSARRLLPVALSHAVLAAAYFYWMRGEDLLGDWLAAVP